MRYNPDKSGKLSECLDLEGNPALEADWPTYTLNYEDGGLKKTMEVAMTFADFALTEGRFRKQFRKAPRDAWNENMVPLADFLHLDEDGREGKFPYINSVDRNNQLGRVIVSNPIVESCEERLQFWHMLKEMAGVDAVQTTNDYDQLLDQARSDVVQKIMTGLMELSGAKNPGAITSLTAPQAGSTPAAASPSSAENSGDYMAPWIETDDCTTCDECTKLNGKIFVYNADKKAIIKDPNGGPYRDLVKAAEKCTAQVIHPGLPADRSAPDIDQWIARGEKYN